MAKFYESALQKLLSDGKEHTINPPDRGESWHLPRPRPSTPRSMVATMSAERRASAAEWLVEYLDTHGPQTLDELMEAAADRWIAPETLAMACMDMGLIVALPGKLRDLIKLYRDLEQPTDPECETGTPLH